MERVGKRPLGQDELRMILHERQWVLYKMEMKLEMTFKKQLRFKGTPDKPVDDWQSTPLSASSLGSRDEGTLSEDPLLWEDRQVGDESGRISGDPQFSGSSRSSAVSGVGGRSNRGVILNWGYMCQLSVNRIELNPRPSFYVDCSVLYLL